MANPWDEVGIAVPQSAPNAPVSDPWAAVGEAVAAESPPISGSPPAPGKGRTDPVPPSSLSGRVRDAFTGESRTEFPEAEEFAPALMRGGVRPEDLDRLGAFDLAGVNRSAVTPDPKAQIDILRKNIPGLESRQDRFGNMMLRAPDLGVNEWTYLNRPGASGRDVDELATQTLATLPFLGLAGRGGNTVRAAAARGFAGLAGGEVAKDALATAAGSEQGVDPVRAGLSGTIGAVTAPGVPSAILQTAANAASVPFQPVASMVRGMIDPEREALRRVGTAEVRDRAAGTAQLTPADEAMAGLTGQPLMTVDHGGDTSRALLRSAANTSPEGRGVIERALGPRFETQSERSGDFFRQIVGPPANAHAAGQTIDQARRGTLGPLYDRAYRIGAVGIHTPGLAALEAEPAMQAGLRAAEAAMRNKQAAGTLATSARGPTTNPTLEYWDQVVRHLADRTTTLRASGAREEARDIGQIRARLLAELDGAFPEYAQARGTAAAFFRASDALEAGENFAMQSFDRAQSRQAVQQMTANERDMFRQGYASRMIERLDNTADRRSVVTQVVGSRGAREKLEIALGPQAAHEMEAFMRVELLMDLPRQALGNSTTARQLFELGLAGGAGLLSAGGDPTNPNAWVTAGLMYGARRGMARVDERVVRQVAEMLVSQDPAVRQRALQQVAGNRQLLGSLRAFDQALTGPGRSAATQQALGPGSEQGPASEPRRPSEMGARAPERTATPESANAMAGQDATNAMATEQGSLGKGAGSRESDNVEDRRPAPQFRGFSDDDLIARYNEIGARPRTEENLEQLRELLYEFERRNLMQLKRPPEQPGQRPNESEGGGRLVPLPPARPQPLNAMSGPRSENAMGAQGQPGSSEDNPIPARTRAEVERLPPGTYVVGPDGVVKMRQ